MTSDLLPEVLRGLARDVLDLLAMGLTALHADAARGDVRLERRYERGSRLRSLEMRWG
jgi:hypothetical protein